MKHLWAAAATTTLLIAGTAYADDDRRDVKASHQLSGFDEIVVLGVYDLEIRVGERFSVRTEASRENAQHLRVGVEANRLVLDMTEKNRERYVKNDQDGAVLAIVTLPRLSSLDITGVATGDVSGIDGGDLDVSVAGVVGDLELEGRCDRLSIELAGVGEIDAEDLVCADVDATLGGVGEMDVHATRSIEADAGGIGQVTVHGNPSGRDVDDGFMSKVRFKS
ncbi:DUF2807 domain-containing protein [uncultured Algimonas sp.]|uniref:GIN domain-containing protein n=1 Tax=uncultured Algimonas sp. TaxID=1547920 RepID=UPI00261F655D|nr:DUF2807 domain-containing protein [uncultured Algimonas sp.]